MIRLSPSSVQFYFESGCPAAWNYSQKWTSPSNEFAERGSMVHRMIEGRLREDDKPDKLADLYHRKVKDLIREYDIKIDEQELHQEFRWPYAEDVLWVRRIDALGSWRGQPVVIDWKTTGGPWKAVVDEYPQAMGAQTPGYLMPPPGVRKWPKLMLYVVVTPRTSAVIPVKYNKTDIIRLNQMISFISANNHEFKVYGRHCLECRFQALCFQTPNWKNLHQRRKNSKKPSLD